MIPAAFGYYRATSIDDALARLKAVEGAKLVAGGHSLVPSMKLRFSQPSALIDIARVPELTGIRDVDGRIEIGACTTHHEVAASALLRDRCPIVAETAAEIGDPQVRNRGTLGGSLAHADPAADYPAAMLAVDAELRLKGPGGWRLVAASRFFTGFFTVDLAPDELIASVSFAPVRTAAYAKLPQRASLFALVGVAAAVDLAGGIIRAARIGLTGAGPHATRLTTVEEALAGKAPSAEVIDAAASLASIDDVNADLHASAEYRRAMIQVFTRRAMTGAIGRA
jgi:carbon-monoxide dehydrogenase medium subunit